MIPSPLTADEQARRRISESLDESLIVEASADRIVCGPYEDRRLVRKSGDAAEFQLGSRCGAGNLACRRLFSRRSEQVREICGALMSPERRLQAGKPAPQLV